MENFSGKGLFMDIGSLGSGSISALLASKFGKKDKKGIETDDAFAAIFKDEVNSVQEGQAAEKAEEGKKPSEDLFNGEFRQEQEYRDIIYGWQEALAKKWEEEKKNADGSDRARSEQMEDSPAANVESSEAKDAAGISLIKGHYFDLDENGLEKGNSRRTVRKMEGNTEQDRNAPAAMSSPVFGVVDVDAEMMTQMNQMDLSGLQALSENTRTYLQKNAPGNVNKGLLNQLGQNYRNTAGVVVRAGRITGLFLAFTTPLRGAFFYY